MNSSRTVLLIFIALIQCVVVYGQETSEKPQKVTEEESRRLEPKIVEAIGWLEQHPFTEDPSERKEVAGEVLQWLIQSPYIGVQLDTKYIREVLQDTTYPHNGLLVAAFLFAKAKYNIDHQSKPDETNSNIAGVEGVVRSYRSIRRDQPKEPPNQGAEMLCKQKDSNKIGEFILSRENEKEGK